MSWHTFSEFAIPHIPQRIESRRSICAPFTKGVIRAGRQIIEAVALSTHRESHHLPVRKDSS
jgi:hypothetical protein